MTDKKTPLGKNQMIANNARLFGKFITQKICTNLTANIKDINCKQKKIAEYLYLKDNKSFSLITLIN